jgi:hypothetical protein
MEEEEEEGERHRGGPLAPGTVAVVRPLREKVREAERRSQKCVEGIGRLGRNRRPRFGCIYLSPG